MAASAAQAGSLKLAWNASPSAEVSGYNIYYGETSKQYTHSVDVGKTTNHTLTGVQPGEKLYIAIAAYCHDCNGFQESGFSNELEVVVPESDGSDSSQLFFQENWNLMYTDSKGVARENEQGLRLQAAEWAQLAEQFLHGGQLSPEASSAGKGQAVASSPLAFAPSGGGVAGGNDLSAMVPPPVELGEVRVSEAWQKVSFRESFLDPVVITAFSEAGPVPGQLRIRHVTGEGFEIRLQGGEGPDDTRLEAQVPFLAMEKGHYTLPNGAKMEAGTLELEANATFEAMDFLQAFTVPPVVLTSVTSDRDPHPVALSKQAIGPNGFELRLQRLGVEASAGMEAVDYIAVEPSMGMAGTVPFEVGQAEQVTSQAFHTLTFLNGYGTPPLVMADFQTRTAGAMTGLRWKEKTAESIQVKVEPAPTNEEEKADETAQTLGYIVFGLEE